METMDDYIMFYDDKVILFRHLLEIRKQYYFYKIWFEAM